MVSRDRSESLSSSNPKARNPTGEHVALLVENTKFIVDPALLLANPDTMLGRMFALRQRNVNTLRQANMAGGSGLGGEIDLVRPSMSKWEGVGAVLSYYRQLD